MATRSFEPSPQCLRDLVLDYLLHNSYIDTARAFASESAAVVHADEIREGLAGDAVSNAASVQRMEGVTPSEELREPALSEEALDLVRLRREIKYHILSGRVDEATQLLSTHFPAVLQENECDAPPAAGVLLPNSSSPFSRLHYTSQLSTKPIHIVLNLRILAFIEAARTVPLVYAGDPKRSSPVSDASAGTDRSPDAYSAHQTALLHRAQRLYASVESLRDTRDREMYRRELNSVGGLLAYTVPEASPMAKYLSQERREAVADQVNSAILHHLGKPAASYIELYVRQTTTVLSVMRDNGVAPPPHMRNNPLAESKTQQAAPPHAKGISGKADKAEPESQVLPPFNLRQFLDGSEVVFPFAS